MIPMMATTVPPALTIQAPETCQDPLSQLLADYGWHGFDNQVAWSIVQRESHGNPQAVGGPHDQDRGLFQLNRPSWRWAPWWDEERLLEPEYNAHAARLIFDGTGWRAWGLTVEEDMVTLDTRDYAWDDETVQAWIWRPLVEALNDYPCLGIEP